MVSIARLIQSSAHCLLYATDHMTVLPYHLPPALVDFTQVQSQKYKLSKVTVERKV